MMWRKVNSFLLRLRYLKVLAEIYILIGLIEFRREFDFSKATSQSTQRGVHFPSPYRLRKI